MPTTADHIMADILADPSDDGLRLIYADWLEDNGDPDRAEFIRDGVAICHPERLNPEHDMGDGWDGVIDTITQYPPWDRSHCPLCAAITRQRNSPIRMDLAQEVGRAVDLLADWSGRKDSGVPYVGVRCRRGFVSELRLPLATWESCGADVVRRHPVERVTLTNRAPAKDSNGWNWGREGGLPTRARLPADVFDALMGGTLGKAIYRNGPQRRFRWYDSEQAALDVLSAALLKLAKGEGA